VTLIAKNGGGVHVNVNQQTAVLQRDRPRSFEEAIEAIQIRRPHENTPQSQSQPTPISKPTPR